MITPGTHTIRAYRWQPFLYSIDIVGYNFSAATFEMQIRLYKDAPGAALISLVNAAVGSQGISATAVTVSGVTTTTVLIRVLEASLEALLPYPASGIKQAEDLTLYYDLVITGGGFEKSRWAQGPFVIEPGVTQ